jgi:hypothetical protein
MLHVTVFDRVYLQDTFPLYVYVTRTTLREATLNVDPLKVLQYNHYRFITSVFDKMCKHCCVTFMLKNERGIE